MNQPSHHFQLLQTSFQETFQTDCAVWFHSEEGWDIAAPADSDIPETAQLVVKHWLAEQAERSTVEFLLQSATEQLMLVRVEIPEYGTGWISLDLPVGNEKLLNQLAEAAIRTFELRFDNWEHESQFKELTVQISDDWEELAFMKQLADQFDSCDLRNDVLVVLKAMLPTIARITRAEVLCFIEAVNRNNKFQPRRTLFNFDQTTELTDQAALAFFDDISSQITTEPYLNNHVAESDQFGHHRLIRNCAAIEITDDLQPVGYLVALNKVVSGSMETYLDGSYFASLHAEPEFGSAEVGILYQSASILRRHSSNFRLYLDKKQLVSGVIRTLACSLECRDPYTFGHSERVALIAKELSAKLGYSATEREELYMTGLLHDIGKIGVPDEVLLKPGKLTDEEFDQIKKHPTLGYQLLLPIKQLHFALPGVLHHHESIDGTGYPYRLKGDEIPLNARILAVADTYDAMTSKRPYRNPMPLSKACSILAEGSGQQWDAELITIFLEHREQIVRQAENTTHEEFQGARMSANEVVGSIMQAVESVY